MNLDLPVLAPSILASDYARLGEQVKACEQGGCSWIHCDIMDGHFVPNISFGPSVVKAVDRVSDAFLDVHLMIEEPNPYIDAFVEAGADLISVHYETCPHLHRVIQNIREHGVMTGVVVNPATTLPNLEPVLNDVDLILIMSVNPGFGGQKFIKQTYDRLQQLAKMRTQHQADFLIEVDGGVNLQNIEKIVRSGADVLVAGSSVFSADDIADRVQELQKRANRGRGEWV